MIEVVKESIFDYNPEDYTWNKYLLLVDPINCNLNVMGKGLALEFKKRYPKEFKKENLKDTEVGIGNVNMINVKGEPGVNIILFPTKIHWSNPSKYWYISASLASLRAYIQDWAWSTERSAEEELSFTIRMPKVGCGLGGLDFKEVYEMIKVIFNEDFCWMLNVTVKVCDV